MSSIILLIFIFGVMETGFRALFISLHLRSGAGGTRYAIVRGSTAGAACGTSYNSYSCIAIQEHSELRTESRVPGIDPSRMTVTVANAGYPAGVLCSPSAGCNNPGNMVTVTVQYNFSLNVPFVPPRT